jgi:hypothetical protein
MVSRRAGIVTRSGLHRNNEPEVTIMKRNTDEVCGACGSRVVCCDECEASFCPSEPAGHACRHDYADDDEPVLA